MATNSSNKLQLQLSPDMREQDREIAEFLSEVTERNTNVIRDALTVYMALSSIDTRLPRTLAGAHYKGMPVDAILYHINNMASLSGKVTNVLVPQRVMVPEVATDTNSSTSKLAVPESAPVNVDDPVKETQGSNTLETVSDVESFTPHIKKASVNPAVRSKHKGV